MDVDGRHLSYNYEIEPDCVLSLTIGVYIRHHKMVIHFYSDILMYSLMTSPDPDIHPVKL